MEVLLENLSDEVSSSRSSPTKSPAKKLDIGDLIESHQGSERLEDNLSDSTRK